ncbi:MAG: hypothetical protein J0L73_19400 [Verrucomicrobia bacterium]|nr:hypothetical protein [Verrucomicrobiota bacterium]
MKALNAKVFTGNRAVIGILVCILILPLSLSAGRVEAARGFLICLIIIIGAVKRVKRSAERS